MTPTDVTKVSRRSKKHSRKYLISDIFRIQNSGSEEAIVAVKRKFGLENYEGNILKDLAENA
jgi:hypothetical protein